MDVLRCISRWELLQQVASGMPTDAALFSPPEQNKGAIKVRKDGGRVFVLFMALSGDTSHNGRLF